MGGLGFVRVCLAITCEKHAAVFWIYLCFIVLLGPFYQSVLEIFNLALLIILFYTTIWYVQTTNSM